MLEFSDLYATFRLTGYWTILISYITKWCWTKYCWQIITIFSFVANLLRRCLQEMFPNSTSKFVKFHSSKWHSCLLSELRNFREHIKYVNIPSNSCNQSSVSYQPKTLLSISQGKRYEKKCYLLWKVFRKGVNWNTKSPAIIKFRGPAQKFHGLRKTIVLSDYIISFESLPQSSGKCFCRITGTWRIQISEQTFLSNEILPTPEYPEISSKDFSQWTRFFGSSSFGISAA